MKIIINGKEKAVKLNYQDILVLAGFKPDQIISVTYRGKKFGDIQRSGILNPGDNIEVEEGMVFNAYDTGNA